MPNSKGLSVKEFKGRNLYVAAVETAAFAFPTLVIYFVTVKVIYAANTPSDRKHALIGFLLVVVVLALVATYSSRIRVVFIQSSREVLVRNVWRIYRIPFDSITQISSDYYAIVKGLGPRLPVVELGYVDKVGSPEKKVLLLASFNAGRNSELLSEFENLGNERSIPCKLSRLIY